MVLSGGDPLACEDAVGLVEYGADPGLRMTMTRGGTSSLTPAQTEALADAGLRRVALSIDGGSPSAHDEFRQEAGSFAETVAAARTGRETEFPLQINTTVCAETVEQLLKFLQGDIVQPADCQNSAVTAVTHLGQHYDCGLEPHTPHSAELRLSDSTSFSAWRRSNSRPSPLDTGVGLSSRA